MIRAMIYFTIYIILMALPSKANVCNQNDSIGVESSDNENLKLYYNESPETHKNNFMMH